MTTNEHIQKILDLLFHNVIDQGGDGDAIWYARYVTLEDIKPQLEEYNKNNNTGWTIIESNDHINWGDNQEWVIITENKEFFDSVPSWYNLKIQY